MNDRFVLHNSLICSCILWSLYTIRVLHAILWHVYNLSSVGHSRQNPLGFSKTEVKLFALLHLIQSLMAGYGA
jgi:hypothetical protein